MNAQERLKALLAAKSKPKTETEVKPEVKLNGQIQQKESEEVSKPEAATVPEVSEPKEVSTKSATSKVELDPSHPLYLPMRELEEKLNNNIPGFETILRDIHLHTGKDPECVTVLTDEEIGIIIKGLERVGGTVVTASAKSSTKKKAPVVAAML